MTDLGPSKRYFTGSISDGEANGSVGPKVATSVGGRVEIQHTPPNPDAASGGVPSWARRATLAREVGVVIPTRDRPSYLPGMLRCLAMQKHSPSRVVVVDDGGDGQTERVVRQHSGVEYVRAGVGNGLSGNPARNIGLQRLVDLPYLCFLDDDDMIPPDYLHGLLEAIEQDCRAAAAYPRFVFCGEKHYRWQAPWDAALLGRINISGAPALIRTDALRQVGGWPVPEENNGSPPLDDWAMWRRLRDHGWRMVPADVDYYYHRHEAALTNKLEPIWHRAISWENLVTIAVPWAGRTYAVDDVLEAIARQTFPASKTLLLFYDSSGDAEFGMKLRRWLAEHQEFAGHSYVRDPRPRVNGMSARELADGPLTVHGLGGKYFGREVNDRVGAIWNRIGQLVSTDLVWCVEDDVIPPPDALERLLATMDTDVDGVTGWYPARFTPDFSAVWSYSDEGSCQLIQKRTGIERVGGCGMGCVLVRKDVFTSGPARSGGETVGYDCNLWLDVSRRGGKLLVDWDLECEHRVRPHFLVRG